MFHWCWREGISSMLINIYQFLSNGQGFEWFNNGLQNRFLLVLSSPISAWELLTPNWSIHQPPLNLWEKCFEYETKQNITISFGHPCLSMIQTYLKKNTNNFIELDYVDYTSLETVSEIWWIIWTPHITEWFRICWGHHQIAQEEPQCTVEEDKNVGWKSMSQHKL